MPVNDEEVTLKEVILKVTHALNYLKSKWLIILVFVLLGIAAGYLYALRQKPIYEAEVTFTLQDDQAPAGSAYSGLASQLGIDIGTKGSSPFAGDNILELMKSRSIVERTLLRPVDYEGKYQTIAEVFINNNKLREAWKENPKLRSIQYPPNVNRDKFTLQQDSVLKGIYQSIISSNLTVEKLQSASGIISVSVKSNNQLFAKTFAEALVKEVSDYYVTTKTKKTTENIAILQHQTDSVRRALNSAISGVASSLDVNPNPNPNRQTLRVGSQRRGFDVQVDQAMLAELVRSLEIAKVTLRKETPLIQIIDRPILPLDAKQFSKVKGIVIGGLLAGVLIVLVLLVTRFLNKVMES